MQRNYIWSCLESSTQWPGYLSLQEFSYQQLVTPSWCQDLRKQNSCLWLVIWHFNYQLHLTTRHHGTIPLVSDAIVLIQFLGNFEISVQSKFSFLCWEQMNVWYTSSLYCKRRDPLGDKSPQEVSARSRSVRTASKTHEVAATGGLFLARTTLMSVSKRKEKGAYYLFLKYLLSSLLSL